MTEIPTKQIPLTVDEIRILIRATVVAVRVSLQHGEEADAVELGVLSGKLADHLVNLMYGPPA